jgi:hypothetical protein
VSNPSVGGGGLASIHEEGERGRDGSDRRKHERSGPVVFGEWPRPESQRNILLLVATLFLWIYSLAHQTSEKGMEPLGSASLMNQIDP